MAAWIACCGCGTRLGQLLQNETVESVDTEAFELLARFVHISDAQIVDEESPARLTFASPLTLSAWRPYEAYSTQLLDGMIRTINKIHIARGPIDFVVHTGDATDNVQDNELEWFITAFDGGEIDPLTGVYDRQPASLPDPLLDPHHPFIAQGLYQNGIHGEAPTIDWYSVLGNHDRFAVGVLPIVTTLLGRRVSPLPLEDRPGVLFPTVLDPTGFLTWSPITPAGPGPPPVLNLPMLLQSNPDRRYVTEREFVDRHLQSSTQPAGHGFDAAQPDQTWYSVSPVPGLRLIALNSATPFFVQPAFVYSEGAISHRQALFLQRELEKAQEAGESVIVATHHPSESLQPTYGTALTAQRLIDLLNAYPCVELHLAGHLHRNMVIDHGGYLEIVTSSIIDAPQQGRVIEIWRPSPSQPQAAEIELRYRMFSHLEDITPSDDDHAEMFADPLKPMRTIAADLAALAKSAP